MTILWTSTKERAPEAGQKVLITWDNQEHYEIATYDSGVEFFYTEKGEPYDADYWAAILPPGQLYTPPEEIDDLLKIINAMADTLKYLRDMLPDEKDIH